MWGSLSAAEQDHLMIVFFTSVQLVVDLSAGQGWVSSFVAMLSLPVQLFSRAAAKKKQNKTLEQHRCCTLLSSVSFSWADYQNWDHLIRTGTIWSELGPSDQNWDQTKIWGIITDHPPKPDCAVITPSQSLSCWTVRMHVAPNPYGFKVNIILVGWGRERVKGERKGSSPDAFLTSLLVILPACLLS